MTTLQPIIGLICRHSQFERENPDPINEERRIKNRPTPITPNSRDLFFDPLFFFDEPKRSSSPNVDSVDIGLHFNSSDSC